MKKIEVRESAFVILSEAMNKASSLIDLVRHQLEAMHASGNGTLRADRVVTTSYQLAAMLELVDNLLMDRLSWSNEMLGLPEE